MRIFESHSFITNGNVSERLLGNHLSLISVIFAQYRGPSSLPLPWSRKNDKGIVKDNDSLWAIFLSGKNSECDFHQLLDTDFITTVVKRKLLSFLNLCCLGILVFCTVLRMGDRYQAVDYTCVLHFTGSFVVVTVVLRVVAACLHVSVHLFVVLWTTKWLPLYAITCIRTCFRR